MFSKGARILLAVVLGCFMFVGLAVASPSHGNGDIKTSCSKGKAKKAKFGSVVGKTILDIACETSVTTTSPVTSTDTSSSISTTPTIGATDTPTTTITASGTPLAHVHLRLMTKKGKKLKATDRAVQSNKKGDFIFKNVKPGTYFLKIWAKNYVPVDSNLTTVTVTAGNTVTIPDIHFTCKTKK